MIFFFFWGGGLIYGVKFVKLYCKTQVYKFAIFLLNARVHTSAIYAHICVHTKYFRYVVLYKPLHCLYSKERQGFNTSRQWEIITNVRHCVYPQNVKARRPISTYTY